MHRLRNTLHSVGGNGMVEFGAGNGARVSADGVGVGGCVEADGRGEHDVLKWQVV